MSKLIQTFPVLLISILIASQSGKRPHLPKSADISGEIFVGEHPPRADPSQLPGVEPQGPTDGPRLLEQHAADLEDPLFGLERLHFNLIVFLFF